MLLRAEGFAATHAATQREAVACLHGNARWANLWDAAGDFVNNNTLTVYIKRLCEKIEEGSANPLIILTVHGAGYRLGGGNAPE